MKRENWTHVTFSQPHDLKPLDEVLIAGKSYTVLKDDLRPGDLYAIPRRWYHVRWIRSTAKWILWLCISVLPLILIAAWAGYVHLNLR